MWLATQNGFYSVVAYDARRDPSPGPKWPGRKCLLVRARARADLDALRRWIPDIHIREDAAADYRYRAVVSRSDWDRTLAKEASQIDYETSFKARVGQVLGFERESLYTQVWDILRGICG
jgi:hypothetical protein